MVLDCNVVSGSCASGLVVVALCAVVFASSVARKAVVAL